MKNKKMPIIALALVALVGIVGGTIAYFSSTAVLPNVFQSQKYKTVARETFVAPTDWKPGTKTQKEVMVTNEGNVPVVVRVTESGVWTNAKGEVIDESPLEDSAKGAIIERVLTNWTKHTDGKYYYNEVLAAGATTKDSYIRSVTFNATVNADVTCEETSDASGKTITCESSEEGYAGAKYTLTLTVETVQSDAVKEVWGNDALDVTA